jgi:hypothetical protein
MGQANNMKKEMEFQSRARKQRRIIIKKRVLSTVYSSFRLSSVQMMEISGGVPPEILRFFSFEVA